MVEEKDTQLDEKSSIIDVDNDSKKETSDESNAGFKDYIRIFTYSDKWDWTLNGVGAVAAAASGASLAL